MNHKDHEAMEADIIRIGNSKGIRLPLSFLKQCGIEGKVELEIKENSISHQANQDSAPGVGCGLRAHAQERGYT